MLMLMNLVIRILLLVIGIHAVENHELTSLLNGQTGTIAAKEHALTLDNIKSQCYVEVRDRSSSQYSPHYAITSLIIAALPTIHAV